MSAVANGRLLVNAGAGTVAFQAGQLVERLLLDRGTEAALGLSSSVVTVEHILSCIDDVLLEQLRTHLDERTERDSRDAA